MTFVKYFFLNLRNFLNYEYLKIIRQFVNYNYKYLQNRIYRLTMLSSILQCILRSMEKKAMYASLVM